MDEERHYPGQTDDQISADVEHHAPAGDEATPEEGDKPAPESEADDQEKPAEKPEADPETPANPPVKKRSIYEDLKAEKKQRKEAQQAAQTAEDRAAELEAQNTELKALLDAKKDATTPQEKARADDDLKAFAEENDMSPEALDRLYGIFEKRVTKNLPKGGPTLTEDELADFRAWRQSSKIADEDKAILAEAPTVKQQLAVSNDQELSAVMQEIVRLSHTKEYHDKEVGYIVWKNQAALAKLVSPKKPSFETGGQGPATEAPAEVDFSKGGITPAMAAQHLPNPYPRNSVEFRKAQ